MRKIEKDMLQAIYSAKDSWTNSNTSVFFISGMETGNPNGGRSEIYLHGNHIADYWHISKEIIVDINTLRRWPSNTTKSRLRALGANVTTKNHITYYNGEAI